MSCSHSEIGKTQDLRFIKDGIYSGHNLQVVKSNAIQCKNSPSLRKDCLDEDDRYDFIPEVQSYILNQLSVILEKQLNELLSNNITPIKNKLKTKGCIKLLKGSEKYLKISKKETSNVKILKRLQDVVLDNEENCKLVAVSARDILKGVDVKNWSKRSKAPVYNYCRDSYGLLVLKELSIKRN